MWCERVLRNLAEVDSNSKRIDYIDIHWDECKSVLKSRSRAGEEVRVLLRPPDRLRHGDVLHEDAARLLVVNVLPCPVIVVRPPDARAMGALALELGNLHWPTQITDSEIIFPPGDEALETLQKLGGLPHTQETRRFAPLPVPAGAVNVADTFHVIRGAPR